MQTKLTQVFSQTTLRKWKKCIPLSTVGRGLREWGKVSPSCFGWPLLMHPNPIVNMVRSGQAMQVLNFFGILSRKALPALLSSGLSHSGRD